MDKDKLIDTIKSLLTLVEETYNELKPTTWQLEDQDEYRNAKELIENLNTRKTTKRIVTIREESAYHCGEYIEGRYYSGVYGGKNYGRGGARIKVDNVWITLNNASKVTFSNE